MPTARTPSPSGRIAALNHPWPFRIVGREAKDHAALRRPRQADIDPAERPTLAVALVVDDQIAVLEAEFAQIVAVEAGRAEAVDPGQDAGDVLQAGAQRSLRHVGVGRLAGRRRRQCRGRGGDRPLVGAGEHGDAAVGLDAHRHFGADQIEAFRAHLAGQQADAGNADFGFRRARDHGAVGVAHHDVAQAQRGAALLVALDLGAADRRRSACRRNSPRSPPSATASPCRVRSGRWTAATTGRRWRPRRPRR